jgi:hypothetical protein
MTTVSARRVGSGLLWCMSSSARKWALATEWGVGECFGGGGSGDMLRRGDLPDLGLLGDRTLAELARRDGGTPLAEWSEFIEAFLSKVGVADRDDTLLGSGELGDFSGREARGVLAGEDVVMVRPCRDRARSPSWPSLLSSCAGCAGCADSRLVGDAMLGRCDGKGPQQHQRSAWGDVSGFKLTLRAEKREGVSKTKIKRKQGAGYCARTSKQQLQSPSGRHEVMCVDVWAGRQEMCCAKQTRRAIESVAGDVMEGKTRPVHVMAPLGF